MMYILHLSIVLKFEYCFPTCLRANKLENRPERKAFFQAKYFAASSSCEIGGDQIAGATPIPTIVHYVKGFLNDNQTFYIPASIIV